MSKTNTAHGITALSPIKNGAFDGQSYASLTRKYLQEMPVNENSVMASVPNTYLSRFYVLNDVFYEGSPAEEEHLKSKYLVFTCNFYGDPEAYLRAMWDSNEAKVREIWQHCVAFDKVMDAAGFCQYIQKCQVKNQLYFVGANDAPLAEQLKALYLKQEFSRFVFENQALASRGAEGASGLQQAFRDFVARTQPHNLDSPTWIAGASKELVHDTTKASPASASVASESTDKVQDTANQPAKHQGLETAV